MDLSPPTYPPQTERMFVNVNPRKALIAFAACAALIVTGAGCAQNDSGGNDTSGYSAPDCDFDDLVEGDHDCDGQRGRDAEKKLSKKQKAELKKAREKRAVSTTPAQRTAPTPRSKATTAPKTTAGGRCCSPKRTSTKRR